VFLAEPRRDGEGVAVLKEERFGNLVLMTNWAELGDRSAVRIKILRNKIRKLKYLFKCK